MISNAAPYTVPREPGPWKSVALAVFVHALLLAFLVIGINWANNTPETLDTEVWSPQELEQAPPPVVTPPPQPVPEPTPEVEKPQTVDPEIALEEDRKRKKKEQEAKEAAKRTEELAQQQEDQKKLDAKKAADDKRKQEAKETKIAELAHKADMARITGEATSTTNGTAAHSQGMLGDASYAARIRALIKSNTHVIVSSDTNAPAQFEVRLLPDGSIASLKKTGTSGYPEFDEAVERAINASAPFPPDKTGTVPKVLPINYRPNDQKS